MFQALTEVFKQSEGLWAMEVKMIFICVATTTMQVKEELEEAAELLKTENGSTVAITSGCDLFVGHVMNVLNTDEGFSSSKRKLLDRLERFKKMTVIIRLEIANHTERFITDDSVRIIRCFRSQH